MKTFRTKQYTLTSGKLPKGTSVKIAFLTDLHGLEFGKDNALLLEAIDREKPDVVACTGDMIVRTWKESCLIAEHLFEKLAAKWPVFYSLGNHEYRWMVSEEWREDYLAYEQHLTGFGVQVLHNQQKKIKIRGTEFAFCGLELPMEYYHKPRSPKLKPDTLSRLAGKAPEDAFGVLLAHNPKYGSTYLDWGADLTLSGHYHGGVLRLSEHHGLTCPQYLLFPPYCCGDFHREERHMIVSAGIGEHTIPVRIHNPRELLLITILGR